MTENGEHVPQYEQQQPNKASVLSPEEVLAHRKSLSDAEGQPYDHYKREQIKAFDTLLERLPKEDPAYAAELYCLLASDDSVALRQQAAQHTHNLFVHDKKVGAELFTHLVNDFELVVRNSAFDSIQKSSYDGAISYTDFKALREEYYDACDRAAIRDGTLKLRPVAANQETWKALISPWRFSVETAVTYIADLEAKQRNARESAAHQDFYRELHYLPGENLPVAIQLLTALAVHENRDIRARVPTYCAFFLYTRDKQAAIDIANTLQQDPDYTISASVKQAFAEAALQKGYNRDEIMRLLDVPTPHDASRKPTLTLVQSDTPDSPST